MAVTKAAEAFRTISEVADELDVPKHVLRFWEGRFPQLRPMKRGGGRRYYRPEDVELLRGIRRLLHEEGYTIKGVQKLIRDHGLDYVKSHPDDDAAVAAAPVDRGPAPPPAVGPKGTRARGRQPAVTGAPLEAALRREAEAALAKLVAARKRIEALKL